MANEAVQEDNGLFSAQDYKLKSISIVTSDGNQVDIAALMIEMNLYEDLFSPAMTGDIRIGDALDIISNFKMHGNEFIQLSIDKPSLNKPIEKTFRIYKISNREFGTNSLQNYTIHFCSEEMLLSTQTLISKSYKGLRIDQMVSDILTNKLKVNKNKIANITQTSGSFDLIVPKMQPFEAINWMLPRAYNNNEHLFFFFENRDGFNFTSFEQLIKQPVYNTYYRNVKTINDPSQNFNSFNYLKVLEDFNTIKAMRYGSFSSSLLVLDLINRNFSSSVFGVKNLPSATVLNKQAAANDFRNRLGKSLYDSNESIIKYVASIDTDPGQNPQAVQKWLPQTITKMGQLHMFKFMCSIPGDVLIKAGSIVNIVIPTMTPQQGATNNDSIRSGKYIVSSVHHKFTMDIMITVLELLTDTVNTDLPPGASTSPGLTEIISK